MPEVIDSSVLHREGFLALRHLQTTGCMTSPSIVAFGALTENSTRHVFSYTYSVRPSMSSINGMHEASVQRESDRVTCTLIDVRGWGISVPNSQCGGRVISQYLCVSYRNVSTKYGLHAPRDAMKAGRWKCSGTFEKA
jgi:hypothetical protein